MSNPISSNPISVDVKPVNMIAAHFDKLVFPSMKAARAVMEKTCFEAKSAWKQSASKSAGRHGRLYPGTIEYTIVQTPTSLTGTVSPRFGEGQADLAYLLEHGSIHNPGHQDGLKALTAQAPAFVVFMTDALVATAVSTEML